MGLALAPPAAKGLTGTRADTGPLGEGCGDTRTTARAGAPPRLLAAWGADLWQLPEVRKQEGPAPGLPQWKLMEHPHWGEHGVSYGWEDRVLTISPNVTGGKPLPPPAKVTAEKYAPRLSNWLLFLFSCSQGLHFFYKVSTSPDQGAFAIVI